MQRLLTETEYQHLTQSCSNLERTILIMSAISTNPYSNEVKIDFFKRFTLDIITSTPDSMNKVLTEWEEIVGIKAL